MTYKAIIFDMDGVLFDTEKFYYDRRKEFLDQKGISITHLPPTFFIGGNMQQVWQHILRDDYDKWDIDTLQKEYIDYKKNILFHTVILFLTTLDRLCTGLTKKDTRLDWPLAQVNMTS